MPLKAALTVEADPQTTFKVKMSAEDNHMITIAETATVLDLKNKLSGGDYENVPAECVRLVYSGREMKDHQSLNEHKIMAGITVHMAIKPQINSIDGSKMTDTQTPPPLPPRGLFPSDIAELLEELQRKKLEHVYARTSEPLHQCGPSPLQKIADFVIERITLSDGDSARVGTLLCQFDAVFEKLASADDFDSRTRSTRDELATLCIKQTPEWALSRMLFHLVVRTAPYGENTKGDMWLTTAIDHWNPVELSHLLREEIAHSSDGEYVEGLDHILNMSCWSRWAVVSLESYSYAGLFRAIMIKLARGILFKIRDAVGSRTATQVCESEV